MMAGIVPPPTALMMHRVVLSTKLVARYPQLSLPPVAAGIVMPGVHDGAPEGAPQLLPTGPPADAQFDPLQQRFGRGGGWGVHVRPGAQPPMESQRQPWVPTMHVVGAPEPAFVPPSLPPEPPEPPAPPLPPGELSDPQPASRIDSAAPTAIRPTSHARLGIEIPPPPTVAASARIVEKTLRAQKPTLHATNPCGKH